jgi:ATP-dependent DNA ligase
MINYQSFQYIYPPRPKNPIQPNDLKIWDNKTMLAQPKINGSNCTIYTNGKDVYAYNRHGQRLTGFQINTDEILKLYRGNGWMVLNGEYTNKSKMDENKIQFSHKFCLFDILVKDGNYLVGSTFKQRVEMIGELYGHSQNYLHQISENIFSVKTFYTDFFSIFESLTQIDMIEGLVLKRLSGKLEVGSSEDNNSKSQIKSRKATKNYKY